MATWPPCELLQHNAWPTPCRRKLEEWSDGDSRELHLEVTPGEERTLEALVRFCYTKQIPFNRGGLLHREAQGGRWTARWAAQGGGLHREAAAQVGGLHREAAAHKIGQLRMPLGVQQGPAMLDPVLGSLLAACSARP